MTTTCVKQYMVRKWHTKAPLTINRGGGFSWESSCEINKLTQITKVNVLAENQILSLCSFLKAITWKWLAKRKPNPALRVSVCTHSCMNLSECTCMINLWLSLENTRGPGMLKLYTACCAIRRRDLKPLCFLLLSPIPNYSPNPPLSPCIVLLPPSVSLSSIFQIECGPSPRPMFARETLLD